MTKIKMDVLHLQSSTCIYCVNNYLILNNKLYKLNCTYLSCIEINAHTVHANIKYI